MALCTLSDELSRFLVAAHELEEKSRGSEKYIIIFVRNISFKFQIRGHSERMTLDTVRSERHCLLRVKMLASSAKARTYRKCHDKKNVMTIDRFLTRRCYNGVV